MTLHKIHLNLIPPVLSPHPNYDNMSSSSNKNVQKFCFAFQHQCKMGIFDPCVEKTSLSFNLIKLIVEMTSCNLVKFAVFASLNERMSPGE